MTSAQDSDERRRFTRFAFDAEAELIIEGQAQPVQLADISLHGFLINEPDGFVGSETQGYLLKVHLAGDEVVLNLPATLVRREPPYLGFVCGDLELETITHLRRLVELNLGDQALLDRELEHLLASTD
ncbi:MAG TPA: PilZ domain-containing protein [Motiliproteus sp.]